jgi:hypothetical protein
MWGAIADRTNRVSPHDIGELRFGQDTPVESPRQCADFVGQWRERLLALFANPDAAMIPN